VRIRERTYGELLELALVLWRSEPKRLAMAAAAGIVPLELLNLIGMSAFQVSGGWWLFLVLLEAPLAVAPLTIVLGGLLFGRKVSAGEVLETLGRCAIPLILYQVVLRTIVLGSLLFAWIWPLRLSFANEVILLERARAGRVLARSGEITGPDGAGMLGRAVLQLLITFAFYVAFFWGMQILARLLIPGQSWEIWRDPERPAAEWQVRVPVWLSVAYFGVVWFLTYIDQRIRLEGWEVALRLRTAGRQLAEDPARW
jgi:hypothetical protein